MSPGAQSRDDTPIAGGHDQRDTGSQPDAASGLNYDVRRQTPGPRGCSAVAAAQCARAAAGPGKRPALLQYGRQPLVVDDRAGLHCLDLVKHLEIERRSVELNRELPVWVIHYLHFLAHQATAFRPASPQTR
jgi:hypothetical protein